MATIGAPADPAHVQHLFKSGLSEIEQEGRARVNIGGRDFFIRKEFVDDLQNNDPKSLMAKFRLPILIMHSPQDTTVGIENAAAIYAAAWHPKSFVTLDGADHLLSKKADSMYTGEVIGTWVKRYLELENPKPLRTNEAVAARTGSESFTTEIVAGVHKLVADEPASVGGNDYGPTPYGYLTAALGACTSMTLRMYAQRKGWDLQEAVVHLGHGKDYKRDCEECEVSGSKIDHFEREIELKGNLDETQRARLLEIADKCPVHKTLHNEVVVNTKLREPAGAS